MYLSVQANLTSENVTLTDNIKAQDRREDKTREQLRELGLYFHQSDVRVFEYKTKYDISEGAIVVQQIITGSWVTTSSIFMLKLSVLDSACLW